MLVLLLLLLLAGVAVVEVVLRLHCLTAAIGLVVIESSAFSAGGRLVAV